MLATVEDRVECVIFFGHKLSNWIFYCLAAEEIKELWEEYENNSSLEANLVKDFDKVCII